MNSDNHICLVCYWADDGKCAKGLKAWIARSEYCHAFKQKATEESNSSAITPRELALKADAIDQDKANVLNVLMRDPDKGWGKISSGLTQDFETGMNSFNVQFDDGSEHCISFKVEEI
jgi:hypothetical protein